MAFAESWSDLWYWAPAALFAIFFFGLGWLDQRRAQSKGPKSAWPILSAWFQQSRYLQSLQALFARAGSVMREARRLSRSPAVCKE